ncbi:MAG TPA: shikimate dehydrogenase, partial [Nitrososphaera sp.]|nr:shikimate dehydrogenase [Nitrososphaera sp.]
KTGGDLGLLCETIALEDATKVSPEAGLIVNATSIGLDSEPSPIDSDHIKKGSVVYDIVYRPVVTDLLEQAKFAEAHVVYGYEMLLEQGARAFEIWTGLPAPRDVMKKNLLGIFGEPT